MVNSSRWRLRASTSLRLALCVFTVLMQQMLGAPFHGAGKQRYLPPQNHTKRPVTVADSICMARVADQRQTKMPAHYSPDGSKFVVVVKKGNLEHNTNDYSLLLWKTNERSGGYTKPEYLLTMSSSSNRGAIEDIMWLHDNETVVFLGETPGKLHQVYKFNIRTRRLAKLTSSVTNVFSFSITPTGGALAYIAEAPLATIWDSEAQQQGIVVSQQRLRDLIVGEKGAWTSASDFQMFFQSLPNRTPPLRLMGSTMASSLFLSPDGRYIVVAAQLRFADIPDSWKEYKDPFLANWIGRYLDSSRVSSEELTDLSRLELVDTRSKARRVLLNSPVSAWGPTVAWSPDSRSVVIGSAYLPLTNAEGVEREVRQSGTFPVEVDVPSCEFRRISQEDMGLLGWDSVSNDVVFEAGNRMSSAMERQMGQKLFFRKNGKSWEQVATVKPQEGRSEILVAEDMNTPPQVVAVDPNTRQQTILLELNPQFHDLAFAKVEAITWKASDGQIVRGGLYWPPDYKVGVKYPLVIQTHGFHPDRFEPDGPFPITAPFAAQALAGRGIMVLQVEEVSSEGRYSDFDTPREIEEEVAAYEGAIDYLDHEGLIDRTRVGIIGFSRSYLYVAYALTHSKYRFAAAALADGIDGGYFQYVAFSNMHDSYTSEVDRVIGAAPFGKGVDTWLSHSPGFNIDKVLTPIRIVAFNTDSALLCVWEWFAVLRHLSKPVDLILLQDGDHILQKPWERMVSQQGNVDWFAFWLRNEEDSDPTKASQYARWRKLRAEEMNEGPARIAGP